MSKFKKPALLIAETIAVFLVTFMLAEITLRVYHHFNPSSIFYDHSYNRYRGKPGAPDYAFNLNSRGFKDVEFKPAKEAGDYRVLALGASFPFGVVPYQHNYLTLLEQQLNGSGHQVEVLNMGIPGIGPRHYLALFANEGLQLQPDMVLVSFFIGNDLTNTPAMGRARFLEYSAVATLIRYLVFLNLKFEGKVVHARRNYDDNAPTLTAEAYLDIEKKRGMIFMKREPLKRTFADAVGYLVRIRELCDAKKIALKVAIIPDELQVNPVLQAKVLNAMNASADEVDFTLPNRYLHEQLNAHRIDYIDLLDDFTSASARGALYKPNDSHWNIAGNKLAADILARYISDEPRR